MDDFPLEGGLLSAMAACVHARQSPTTDNRNVRHVRVLLVRMPFPFPV